MDNEYKILLLVRRDVDREDGWDRSALRGTLFISGAAAAASLGTETAGHPGCAALAAGSAGPRRRRRSLRVHLPRGKGGWPRP